MNLSYKYCNHTFFISCDRVKNKALRTSLISSLRNAFKGFINDEECFDKSILHFSFTDDLDSLFKSKDFVFKNKTKVSDSQTYFSDDEISFIINHDNLNKIYVGIKNRSNFFSSKLFNKSFKNSIDLQISAFYYRIFLLYSQIWNVNNNYTYLHASSIQKDNDAILFSADSGVGKSSLLIALSDDKSIKFISDDLTIISQDSKCFFQGRCISIKPYHLDLFHVIKNKLTGHMPFLQKVQWNLINDNRLNYRLNPSLLFKERICQTSKIKRVIHIVNHNSVSFKIEKISVKKFCSLAIPILMNELFLANHKLNKLSSLNISHSKSVLDIYNSSKMIIEKAFKNIEIQLVYAPHKTHPNVLSEFLKKKGCLD